MSDCKKCVHNVLCQHLRNRLSPDCNAAVANVLGMDSLTVQQCGCEDCVMYAERPDSSFNRMQYEKMLCDLHEKNEALRKKADECLEKAERLAEKNAEWEQYSNIESNKYHERDLRITRKLERVAGILDALCFMLPEGAADVAGSAFENVEYALKEMSGNDIS